MTYVAAEPEKVEGYLDCHGKFHENRDVAFAENFEADLTEFFNTHCSRRDTAEEAIRALKSLERKKPEMLRVLLGDRGYT